MSPPDAEQEPGSGAPVRDERLLHRLEVTVPRARDNAHDPLACRTCVAHPAFQRYVASRRDELERIAWARGWIRLITFEDVA